MKDNQDIAIGLTDGQRGSFMKNLGHAYCQADESNRQRLEWAFPHVFTEPAFRDTMAILVVGNPVDGFEFIGPFESKTKARDYSPGLLDAWVAADLLRPTPD